MEKIDYQVMCSDLERDNYNLILICAELLRRQGIEHLIKRGGILNSIDDISKYLGIENDMCVQFVVKGFTEEEYRSYKRDKKIDDILGE